MFQILAFLRMTTMLMSVVASKYGYKSADSASCVLHAS